MEDPRIAQAEALARATAEPDSIMEDYSGRSPLYLADELMRGRDAYDQEPEFAFDVAEVLRGRQAEWLKGRRWPDRREIIPGKPELMRTSDGAQLGPDEDA